MPSKQLLGMTVLDAAKERIAWAFETFPRLYVSFSGGKESKVVRKRIKGYLPITLIRADREGRADRIASTIRHNRARGKHQVQAMSEIVQELARRNWSGAKIGRELGMDADEVLRLKQISGLAEMFADRAFSEAWHIVEDD